MHAGNTHTHAHTHTHTHTHNRIFTGESGEERKGT